MPKSGSQIAHPYSLILPDLLSVSLFLFLGLYLSRHIIDLPGHLVVSFFSGSYHHLLMPLVSSRLCLASLCLLGSLSLSLDSLSSQPTHRHPTLVVRCRTLLVLTSSPAHPTVADSTKLHSRPPSSKGTTRAQASTQCRGRPGCTRDSDGGMRVRTSRTADVVAACESPEPHPAARSAPSTFASAR